ncbi:hypothetical protein J6590_027096 [Homalodisca vitripennis]|nr:hypothetical protein J6590_027096 [Homalodisca vitripennis]
MKRNGNRDIQRSPEEAPPLDQSEGGGGELQRNDKDEGGASPVSPTRKRSHLSVWPSSADSLSVCLLQCAAFSRSAAVYSVVDFTHGCVHAEHGSVLHWLSISRCVASCLGAFLQEGRFHDF